MSAILEAVRHFRRQLDFADQRIEQAGDRGGEDRVNDAIDFKKAVESEIIECLILVKHPAGLRGAR
ncbi:MAG TPA: hypothetical protein VHZ78_08720 [Rhizomicrobium sp.]|jgi:hypothetical protein|nr:hypothetical protein [Rhizomicrobium sp.]